jgi:hypothetical protein
MKALQRQNDNRIFAAKRQKRKRKAYRTKAENGSPSRNHPYAAIHCFFSPRTSFVDSFVQLDKILKVRADLLILIYENLKDFNCMIQ